MTFMIQLSSIYWINAILHCSCTQLEGAGFLCSLGVPFNMSYEYDSLSGDNKSLSSQFFTYLPP